MEINSRIEEQLNNFPLLLYMKGTPDFPQCGFSAKVCGILKASGKRFAFVNILEDPELRDGLKSYSNWPTFPQLYINGELSSSGKSSLRLHTSSAWAPLPRTLPKLRISR